MSGLTRTQAVLTSRSLLGPDGAVFYVEDPDSDDYYRQIQIDRTTFEDLGSPLIVTITIEPGDRLNP